MPQIQELYLKPMSELSEDDLTFITEESLKFNTNDKIRLLGAFLSVLAEGNDILSIQFLNERTRVYKVTC